MADDVTEGNVHFARLGPIRGGAPLAFARPSSQRRIHGAITHELCFKVLKNYATFQGRAHRTEYWMYSLVDVSISIGLIGLAAAVERAPAWA